MLVYCPNGADGTGGLSSTGVSGGIGFTDIELDTEVSGLQITFEQGDRVGCADPSTLMRLIASVFLGVIKTGADTFKVGATASGTVTVWLGDNAFIRKNASTGNVEISADGVSTFIPGATAASLTGGDGIDLTSGTISVDLADAIVFVATSSGAADEGLVALLDSNGKFPTGFVNGGSCDLSQLTVTASQINSVVSTASNTGVLGETVAAGETLCEVPYQVKYFNQMTEGEIALGDANARRRYSIKITPKKAVAEMPDLNFRLKKYSAGQDVTVRIETDSSGEASGTLVDANATATISAGDISTSFDTEIASWAGAYALALGTTVHIVLSVASTDGTNYIGVGVNSSYDENYMTFERQTFDQDTLTWGNAVTNATPFFWTDTEEAALGMTLLKTDANYLGKLWRFVGIALEGGDEDDEISYTKGVYTGASDLTPGLPVYLSATAGEYSQTKLGNSIGGSSFCYKIGIADSDTNIRIEPGDKLLVGQITGTDTTATDLLPWFPVQSMEIHGSYIKSGVILISQGVYDGVSNIDSWLLSETGSGSTVNIDVEGSYSFGGNATTNGFEGAGGDDNEVGFTYTVTKNGTATEFGLTYTLRG